MYCVYVLYDNNKFYIGYTTNVKRRLKEHLRGKIHTTKRYNLEKLRLIYKECFVSEKDARRRERFLKTTKGRKGLKLILRDTLELDCGVV